MNLKIRAYDKENKVLLRWHQLVSPQYNICLAGQMEEYLQTQKRFTPLLYDVLLDNNKYEISVWAGINDQLERNLFEGDIVYSQVDNQDYLIVHDYCISKENPEDATIGFRLRNIKTEEYKDLQWFLLLIGNKWETPELLK